MSGAFQVEGDERLRATLQEAGDQLGDLSAAAKRAGDVVVSAARSRAPSRSGRLASSLFPVVTADGVRVGARAPYAGVVHWGWPARGIRANPFLSDAATSTEGTWVGYYADEVQAAVNGVKGA